MKPTNLPERLSKIAFINGEEFAWKQEDCGSAIDWLSQNGYAILGFELWLVGNGRIRTAIHTKSGPGLYVTNCDPVEHESWECYVKRSAQDAVEKIGEFRWPADAIESPAPVYFNLAWADREWFLTRKTNGIYFIDE
jgi:hypothetical protein